VLISDIRQIRSIFRAEFNDLFGARAYSVRVP